MTLYREFQLQHAGHAGDATPGVDDKTVRVQLWFYAERTTTYQNYLDGLCDAMGIQGIMAVVPSTTEEAKVVLVVDSTVNVQNAVGAWIEKVNAHLATVPEELLASFGRINTPLDEVLAVSGKSSSGVVSTGGNIEA